MSDLKARAEAERSGQPFLLFRDRDDRQQRFLFTPELASASVGRRSSADLVLDWDAQVSRVHAQFERVDDGWEVVDDGLSSNGTFVNEERLSGRRRLNDGDTLRFGTTTVTFHSHEREPLRMAEAAGAPPEAERPHAAGAPPAAETPPTVSLSTTQRRVLVALCRPYKGQRGFASPATDQQIAEELVLSVSEVRAHLRVLHAKLGVDELSHGETRVRLVERAFSAGLISQSDI